MHCFIFNVIEAKVILKLVSGRLFSRIADAASVFGA
jgi:hypothetical protein